MEEHTQPAEEQNSSSSSALVIGALVVVAVVGIALYVLRAKPAMQSPTTQETTTPIAAETVTPTPGPISKLACESQFYNPIIGFPKYYLSAEGADLKDTSKVECKFVVNVGGKTVATEKVDTAVIQAPERGGVTFRCTTAALELEKSVPTKVDVTMTNGAGQTATCTKTFALP